MRNAGIPSDEENDTRHNRGEENETTKYAESYDASWNGFKNKVDISIK